MLEVPLSFLPVHIGLHISWLTIIGTGDETLCIQVWDHVRGGPPPLPNNLYKLWSLTVDTQWMYRMR
jgi:hypothetical protein